MSDQTEPETPSNPLDDLTVFLAETRRSYTSLMRSVLRRGVEAGIKIGEALAAGVDKNSVEKLTAEFVAGEIPLSDPTDDAREISAACQILAASLSGRRMHERYWFKRRELYAQLIRQGSWMSGPRNCIGWIRELRRCDAIPFLKDQQRNYRGYLYYPFKDEFRRLKMPITTTETGQGKYESKKIPA